MNLWKRSRTIEKRNKEQVEKVSRTLYNQIDVFLAYGDEIRDTDAPLGIALDRGFDLSFNENDDSYEENEQIPIIILNDIPLAPRDHGNSMIAYLNFIRSDLAQGLGIPEDELFKSEKHPMDQKYPHSCPKCKKELKFEHMMQREFSPQNFYFIQKSNREMNHYKFTIPNYLKCVQKYRELKETWKTRFIKVKGKKIPLEILCCSCYDSFNRCERIDQRIYPWQISLLSDFRENSDRPFFDFVSYQGEENEE
jgi:hypothetical protein